jgi:hypothetical protein
VSGFFEPPPPPEPEPVPAQPAWQGPPPNELGVPVPLARVLARTDDVAVALVDVSAFSTGLQFRLEVRLRRPDDALDPLGMHPARRRGTLPDDVLRFGFELPDGRRVTNLGGFPPFGEPRDGAVLLQRGGGGGGRSWSFAYWLWPLPPPGVLTAAVEWPGRGIALERVELDADALLAAAAASERLWPEGEEPEGGSTGTFMLSGG